MERDYRKELYSHYGNDKINNEGYFLMNEKDADIETLKEELGEERSLKLGAYASTRIISKELEGMTAERDHYRVGVNNLTKERDQLKEEIDCKARLKIIQEGDRIIFTTGHGRFPVSQEEAVEIIHALSGFSIEQVEEAWRIWIHDGVDFPYDPDDDADWNDFESKLKSLQGKVDPLSLDKPNDNEPTASSDVEEKEPISRIEIITKEGRQFVRWNCSIKQYIQDDGRTLKIFVEEDKDQGEECPECSFPTSFTYGQANVRTCWRCGYRDGEGKLKSEEIEDKDQGEVDPSSKVDEPTTEVECPSCVETSPKEGYNDTQRFCSCLDCISQDKNDMT